LVLSYVISVEEIGTNIYHLSILLIMNLSHAIN
jgi:hypothetical protein